MNLDERFFQDLSEDELIDRSFIHVKQLGTATEDYLVQRTLSPKRYVCKKKEPRFSQKSNDHGPLWKGSRPAHHYALEDDERG